MIGNFLTNKQAREQITALEARITELETDAVSRDDGLTEAHAQLSAASETVTAHATRITELSAELETAEATIATQAAALAATPDAQQIADRVEAAVLAKFQSIGGEPLPASSKDETKSKADFSGLTGFQKISASFAKK